MRISRIVCDGGYLDVKVRVFQIQWHEPVPWAYLQEDLFPSNHPERPFHQGVIKDSEIKKRSQAAVFFGDEEVVAVKAWLALGRRNDFYGTFPAD